MAGLMNKVVVMLLSQPLADVKVSIKVPELVYRLFPTATENPCHSVNDCV